MFVGSTRLIRYNRSKLKMPQRREDTWVDASYDHVGLSENGYGVLQPGCHNDTGCIVPPLVDPRLLPRGQVDKELKAGITRLLFRTVSGHWDLCHLSASTGWRWARLLPLAPPTHWAHLSLVWKWAVFAKVLIHLELLYRTWLNSWQFSTEDPPRTCRFTVMLVPMFLLHI